MPYQQDDPAAKQEVKITRADLDTIIYLLQAAEDQLANTRQTELDIRMLRTRLETVRHDLEPITKRCTPTPFQLNPLETTIVKLPKGWPDKPRGG